MKYLEVMNKVIEDMGKVELDNNAQQTTYLGLISLQLTAIADELARMNDGVKSNNTVNCACTDEEIVKPYLEKLKADIEVAYDELDGYDPDALSVFASRIDDLIDNLLSESEGKEWQD